MKGCFVSSRSSLDRLEYVFRQGRKELFEQRLELCGDVVCEDNLEEHASFLREVEVILCTWGMVSFTRVQLEQYFPKLKILFYSAGSVQYFARPFLERKVRIVSAWGVMCQPVAEFTVSSIVFLNKGAFLAANTYRKCSFEEGKRLAVEEFPGTYGTKVGILGAGMIGSCVIELLRSYTVELMVYDPFLPPHRMEQLGLERTHSLEEIFSQCQTVSNHIANNPQTVGMLDYSLFSLMGENAAFVNTGRGAQVVEADLIQALQEQPRRFALLDVTWPEPMERENPLLSLPNVLAFPHIAGYAAREVLTMPDCMYRQLCRYQDGESVEFEVTLEMLDIMA